ncbi:hypothetical protein [Aeromonas enteropelogenes]|uniref:hypothetical protein n=1 Tax=Aeromonas enteropelogenes TaxID=29489 RepID=UPI003BA2FE90
MSTLSDKLLDFRFDIADDDGFYSVSSSNFNRAVKTAYKKYVAKYNSHANSTSDFVLIYEYSSFLGFIQGFAITDYCIYGDEGSSFELPLRDLASVKYDESEDEFVFTSTSNKKYYIKVASSKKGLARQVATLINNHL